MNTCYHCGKGIKGAPVFKRLPKVWIDLNAKNPTYDFPIAAHADCDKRAESDAAKELAA
jgi:hypothetical protein